MNAQRVSILDSSRWIIIATAITRPLQLVGNVLLAHMLGPNGMGTFGLSSSFAVTLSGILGMGLGDATNKFLAENYRRDPERGRTMAATAIWISIVSSLFLLIIVWLGKDRWQDSVFPGDTPSDLIAFSLVLAWGNILVSLCTNVFSGLQRFRHLSITNVLQVLVNVFASVVLSHFFGVRGAMAGYILGNLVFAVAALGQLMRIDYKLFQPSGLELCKHMTELVVFCTPFWLGYFTIGPLTTLTSALLAKQPNGESELGVFNAANALKMLVATLPGMIGPVLNSAIIEAGGQRGDGQAFLSLLRRSVVALMFLALPVLTLTVFYSKEIFSIYGEKFENASSLYLPLAASVALQLLSSAFQFGLIARGWVWGNFALGTLQCLLVYGLAVLLVPENLASGLAWAHLMAQIGSSVLFFELAALLTVVSGDLRKLHYGFMVTIVAVLAVCLSLPQWWRLVLGVPITFVILAVIFRRFKELKTWLSAVAPSTVRPLVDRLVKLAEGVF